jgi:hypothetical protein
MGKEVKPGIPRTIFYWKSRLQKCKILGISFRH